MGLGGGSRAGERGGGAKRGGLEQGEDGGAALGQRRGCVGPGGGPGIKKKMRWGGLEQKTAMCGAGCEPQNKRKMWGGGSRTDEQDALGWVGAV